VSLALQGLLSEGIALIIKYLESGQHIMSQSVSAFENDFAGNRGVSFVVMFNI
jgi:hypothetical protein